MSTHTVQKERNYGIDLLRIISMLMVVLLHLLWQGGILQLIELNSKRYWLLWLLEIGAYCAVNCFALISGFVMWNSKQKPKRLLNLWTQTLFYTVLITIIFLIFNPEVVTEQQIIGAFLPFTSKQYWYVSAYFCLYLFMPILNTAIGSLPRETLRNTLFSIIGATCFLPILLNNPDAYAFRMGYSTIWLMVLYLVGGYIAKYKVHKKYSLKSSAMAFCAAMGITFLVKLLFQMVLGWTDYEDVLILYTSPTILVCGLSLLILCANLKVGGGCQKIVKVLAPATLGVYLIHVHPLVWGNIIVGSTITLVDNDVFSMVGFLMLAVMGIYAVCTVIELGRIWVFGMIGRKWNKK